jgi:hypothetical protein
MLSRQLLKLLCLPVPPGVRGSLSGMLGGQQHYLYPTMMRTPCEVSPVGFEPTTLRFEGACSDSAELRGGRGGGPVSRVLSLGDHSSGMRVTTHLKQQPGSIGRADLKRFLFALLRMGFATRDCHQPCRGLLHLGFALT